MWTLEGGAGAWASIDSGAEASAGLGVQPLVGLGSDLQGAGTTLAAFKMGGLLQGLP